MSIQILAIVLSSFEEITAYGLDDFRYVIMLITLFLTIGALLEPLNASSTYDIANLPIFAINITCFLYITFLLLSYNTLYIFLLLMVMLKLFLIRNNTAYVKLLLMYVTGRAYFVPTLH